MVTDDGALGDDNSVNVKDTSIDFLLMEMVCAWHFVCWDCYILLINPRMHVVWSCSRQARTASFAKESWMEFYIMGSSVNDPTYDLAIKVTSLMKQLELFATMRLTALWNSCIISWGWKFNLPLRKVWFQQLGSFPFKAYRFQGSVTPVLPRKITLTSPPEIRLWWGQNLVYPKLSMSDYIQL